MKTKAIAVILATTLLLVGCLGQSSLAALVSVVGNAAASLAAIEGNPSLADKLRTDATAVHDAVLNWKKGTPSQDVIQVLGLLEDDLNLIPFSGPAIPLISLALVTVEEIITIVTNNSPTPVAVKLKVPKRKVVFVGEIPNNARQFKRAWNKLAAADPKTASAVIK